METMQIVAKVCIQSVSGNKYGNSVIERKILNQSACMQVQRSLLYIGCMQREKIIIYLVWCRTDIIIQCIFTYGQPTHAFVSDRQLLAAMFGCSSRQ